MQRRVAAIYFVFFLVMGASAYSVIALADAPAVEVSGETYSDGDTFTVGDRQYLVQVGTEQSSGGGGHGGGGGGTTYVGNLTYTNSSYQFSATLGNNSTVQYRDAEYRVLVENESNAFTLREEFNVSGILMNDSAVYNTTTRVNGEPHVTYRENNTNVPLDEYLPEPATERFSEGDSMQYQGNETTVASVTASEATLTWTGERDETVELSEGTNVTLSGTQYFAHFSGHGDGAQVTIAPTQEAYPAYTAQLNRVDYFDERMNGLWGVVILAGIAALLVVSMALMPVKG
ncbi:hypothetical protein [Halorarius halobius]|uniref:hypothetical protein n=1 Tax=Halorarius halobius TaxID=2962671 RepID=UPI0020CB6F62|nr:hypothetical protein [Halorarius halobius]